MASATSSTIVVHHTGFQHIDGVAVGSELTAVATSSLTGDLWNGGLILMHNASLATASVVQPPACVIPTAHGNAGVAWIAPDALATGNDSGDVVMWHVTPGKDASAKPLATFTQHCQPITSITYGKQARLASTSLDGTAVVWQANVAGEAIATLEHLPLHAWCDVQVHASAWLGDAGQTFATSASDGVVRLWDLRRSPSVAERFTPHTAPLLTIANGAAEHQLLVGSECGALFLLDARRLDAPVATTSPPPLSAAISSLAPRGFGLADVAVGSEDGSIAHVDARDLHLISREEHAHKGRVGALAWLGPGDAAGGSGQQLLSGGWDKQLLRRTMMAPQAAVSISP